MKFLSMITVALMVSGVASANQPAHGGTAQQNAPAAQPQTGTTGTAAAAPAGQPAAPKMKKEHAKKKDGKTEETKVETK